MAAGMIRAMIVLPVVTVLLTVFALIQRGPDAAPESGV